MRKSISFWMLGIAAMLASCSQNEDLLQGEYNEKASKVTFSVNIDTGMRTRVVTDENDETPTRCVVGWYTQGGDIQKQEFTVTGTSFDVTVPNLEAETEYTFIFWADGGEEAYDASDLTKITRGSNPSIAFRNIVTTTPNSETQDVTLTHAVAKVVAKQVGNDLTADDKIGFSFNMPDYSYNLQDNTLNQEDAAATLPISAETTVSDAALQGELLSAYVFAPSGETGEVINSVALWYEPVGKAKYETTITNVPLKQNYRTVLMGDFSSLHAGMTFTANIENQWEDDIYPNEVEGNIITLSNPGTLSDSEIAAALGATGNSTATVVIEGEMNSADFNTLAYYNSNLDNKRDNADNTYVLIIDLSEATGLDEIPDDEVYGVSRNHFANVQKLILPKTCTKVGSYAFHNSGILGVEGVGVIQLWPSCFDNTLLEEANFPSATYMGTYAFQLCKNLKTLKLTAAGTFDVTVNRRILTDSSTESTTLYLNSDKNMDAENEITPKAESETSWLGYTFKEIIFEEPNVTE